jgi:drug/metabolite transporter (DMT)-like permease
MFSVKRGFGYFGEFLMDGNYILGVSLAILCGFLINGGLLCQKKVINEIPEEARKKRFMRTLIRHPLWLTGFLLEFVGGAVTFILAQNYIGSALVPGLLATGYIVLVVGSIRILGETLKKSEYLGILLLFFGVALVGLSGLDILPETVKETLDDPGTIFRIIVFTVTMFVLWGLTHFAALKSRGRKGIIMGFSNGFPFSLSNFWIAPLLAVIWIVLGGTGTSGQIIIFIISCIIMIAVNLLGIRQTQEAFKFGDAHNVIPMQQIPVQIMPVLYYFSVFSLKPPSRLSVVSILAGALLIIVSGFFLAKRQAELERID